MRVLCTQYSTFRHLIFHFSKPTLENERPSQTVQHFSIPHLLKLSISFIIFIPVFHCDKISGLRLHNGMMSSRKNIQKQCPDLRPRNGMMSPPKTPTIIPVSETFSATVWKLWGNTPHNSGVLNIQHNGMEALGSSGGALGELWGALGTTLTKIRTKSHIHFELLADPSLI